MNSSAPYRHGVVDQWLKPRYCRCDAHKVAGLLNGHVPDCPVPKYQRPAKLIGVVLPATVAGLQKALADLERSFSRMQKMTEQSHQDYVLRMEAIYLRMAELVHALPGQPNSMDKYMLCSLDDMVRVHTYYSEAENQKDGLLAKRRIQAKYGFK